MAMVMPGDAWSAIAVVINESSCAGSASLIPTDAKGLDAVRVFAAVRAFALAQPAAASRATARQNTTTRRYVITRVRMIGGGIAASAFLARRRSRTYSCGASSIKHSGAARAADDVRH